MSQADSAGAPAGREFVISRAFDAPRELVYKAWTERERLEEWFGPKGMTMVVKELDLRPGGTLLGSMTAPGGQVMWGKWTFREVVPPERLVFVQSFSDEHGGMGRHPLAPDWPRQTLSTVTFEERDGKTTLTVRGVPLDATEAERAAFEAGFESMKGGWGGTFEALDAYLATA